MLAYLTLLERWNAAYNLTSVREPREIVTRHLLDSLSVLPWAGSGRLLDAGTGAGLPGVPIAIFRQDLDVTLVDSVGKKVRFLGHVQRELGLANLHPLRLRLETWNPQQPFETVVSRAFGSLNRFVAATRHVLAPGGRWLAMKGRVPREEITSLGKNVRVDAVERVSVPGLQEARHLVIMSLTS